MAAVVISKVKELELKWNTNLKRIRVCDGINSEKKKAKICIPGGGPHMGEKEDV